LIDRKNIGNSQCKKRGSNFKIISKNDKKIFLRFGLKMNDNERELLWQEKPFKRHIELCDVKNMKWFFGKPFATCSNL